MSDTPRTDEYFNKGYDTASNMTFCRELERELNAANEAILDMLGEPPYVPMFDRHEKSEGMER